MTIINKYGHNFKHQIVVIQIVFVYYATQNKTCKLKQILNRLLLEFCTIHLGALSQAIFITNAAVAAIFVHKSLSGFAFLYKQIPCKPTSVLQNMSKYLPDTM